MHISVCICSYRRPQQLRKLLIELLRQDTRGRFRYSIVVADNDREQSARTVVLDAAAEGPVAIRYCLEREQNIAMARNKAIGEATGDFIAFIDDDERPPRDWLATLLNACIEHDAAGVLAPVRPLFEQEPPGWLIRGKFCERPEHPTGHLLTWRETRTGNVLFRRSILDGVGEPFHRALGNGGEDQEFFKRMMARGCRFVWCNEAAVVELVPPERWRRAYLVKRALQRGQCEKDLADSRAILKSIIAIPTYSIMLPFLAIAGQHLFMRYLIRLFDHAGRLLGVMGLKPLGNTYVSG